MIASVFFGCGEASVQQQASTPNQTKPNQMNDVTLVWSREKMPAVKTMKDLTEEEIEDYREAFKNFDKDDSGSIDEGELGVVMRSLGFSPTNQQLKEMMAKVCSRCPILNRGITYDTCTTAVVVVVQGSWVFSASLSLFFLVSLACVYLIFVVAFAVSRGSHHVRCVGKEKSPLGGIEV